MRWHRHVVRPQAFKMKLDGFPNLLFCFFNCGAGGDGRANKPGTFMGYAPMG
jgi:hypothetical protein